MEITEIGQCVKASDVTPVHLTASDGIHIAAVQWGNKGDGVVLTHQGGASLCDWAPYADAFVKAGFQVLAIDMRGHGSSEARCTSSDPDCPTAFGDLSGIPDDVIAAGKYLRKEGAKKVFAVGASLGGAASVTAVAREPALFDAMAALSAPGIVRDLSGKRMDLGWTGLEEAKKLNVPSLFVASKDDQPIYSESKKMSEEAHGRLLSEPAGTGHAMDIVALKPGVLRIIIDFLKAS